VRSISISIDSLFLHSSGRIVRVRKDRWATAFHFDDISAKAVDDITTNCFAEQRKQLREKFEIATP